MAKVVKGVVKAIGAIASVLAVIPSPIQPIAAAVATVAAVASVGLEMIFPTKPKPPDLAGSQTSFRLDPNAGIPYMIGRTFFAGSVIHRDTWGKDNQYHGMGLVWSGGGPIEEIESFEVDLVTQNFNGTAATGKYAGFMNLSTQLGATPSPALASPIAGFPGWSGGMSGYAGGVWVCTFDKEGDKFAGGLPKAGIIGKGVRVYDPRLDSTYPGGAGTCRIDDQSTWVGGASARNPWLHGLAIALGRWENGKKVFGIGMAAASLNLASIVDAANVADANGWEVGGMLSSTDDKWGMLKLCAQAGGGQFVRLGAKLTAFVNAPRVSLATIEESDIVGSSKLKGTQHIRSRINRVVPQFRSEAHGWEIIPGSAVAFQEYIDEDGGRRTAETTFGLVQDADQAGNLAAYEIVNAREIGPIDLELSIAWAGLEPGDAVTVNLPSLGLVNRKCVVLARGLDPSTGNVAVSLRTETDAKHALALGTSTIVPPTPTLSPRDLSIVAAPEADAWALGATGANGPNGETVPLLEVTGDADNQTAEAVVLRFREVTDPASDWILLGDLDPTATRIEINGLRPATAYEVEIAYKVFGVLGAFRNLGTAVTGALTAGGFVNGGTLAYEDAVSFNDGTILESAGGAIATLASFRTADGTAAAIAGQGALATTSSVSPSLMGFVPGQNYVLDPEGLDPAAWTLSNGNTPETSISFLDPVADAVALADLEAEGGFRMTGTGQARAAAGIGYTLAVFGQRVRRSPDLRSYLVAVSYRASADYAYSGGGTPRIQLRCIAADGSNITWRYNHLNPTPGTTGVAVSMLEVPANTAEIEIAYIAPFDQGQSFTGSLEFSKITVLPSPRLDRIVRSDGVTASGGDAALITSQGTASAITGQSPWATTAISIGRVNNLSDSGNLASLSNVSTRNLSLLTGRAWTNLYRANGTTPIVDADAITAQGTAASIAGQGALATKSTADWFGDVANRPTFTVDTTTQGGSPRIKAGYIFDTANAAYLSSRWPQEAGSNKTETRTSAAFAGQGALATRSTVGIPQLFSEADFSDLVIDPKFADFANSWVGGAGANGTYSLVEEGSATAAEQTALDAMGVDRCLKLVGDGNPHGGAGTAFMSYFPNREISVTPGEVMRLRAKVYVENATGATLARLVLQWRRADGTNTFTVPNTSGVGLIEFDQLVVVPANAVTLRIQYQPIVPNGTTADRDFVGYYSGLSLRRVAQLGSDLSRANGTTPVGEADAITNQGTAAAITGQGAWATAVTTRTPSQVDGRVSRIQDNGRADDGRFLNSSNNFGLRALSETPTMTATAQTSSATVNFAADGILYPDWGGSISLPSASFPGLANLTRYYFWRNMTDPDGSGTSYGYSTDLLDALGTGKVYLGYYDTPANSGSGGGGGGGGGFGGGDCVAAGAFVPSPKEGGRDRLARNIRKGAALKVLDEDGLDWTATEAAKNKSSFAQCVAIETESGIRLTLALNTPMTTHKGAWIPACNATGYRIPVEDADGFRWERVKSVKPVGLRVVAKIEAGGATYAAGDEKGRYIYSHNDRLKP